MKAVSSWISALSFLKKSLLAFVLGLAIAAALPPLHLIFLLPVSFTGLLWILSSVSTRKQAFFVGWWFAWGQFIAGLYWIGVAFTIDAETHALLLPLPMCFPLFLRSSQAGLHWQHILPVRDLLPEFLSLAGAGYFSNISAVYSSQGFPGT